jgi:DNA-binding CsgD family transcriptional regulator
MQQPFVPTTCVDEAARQLGAGTLGATLLRAVVHEPATGVGLVSGALRLCYGNKQLARIFIGADADPKDFVGRNTGEFLPQAWVRERLPLYDRAFATGTPFLMRVIWNDHQHFTWHYPLPAHDDHHKPLLLIITRRISSDAEASDLAPPDSFDVHDARFVRFLSLDVLTPRELEVLSLLGNGFSAGEVGAKLGLSEKSVDNHRSAIYAKLNVTDRASVISIARRAGLTLADAARPRI